MLLLAAALPSVSAGTESMPEIRDVRGDVTRDGASVSDALAQALDLTAVWYTKSASGASWVHFAVAGLPGVPELIQEPWMSLQYGAVFTAGGSGPTYQVSAGTGGTNMTDSGWSCQVQARETDTWSDTLGYIDLAGGRLHIRLTDQASQDLASANLATDLSAQAWGSSDKDARPQTSDWASSYLPYLPSLEDAQAEPDGTGLLPCGTAPLPEMALTPGLPGPAGLGDLQVADPANDVERDNKPVSDALARSLDIIGISFTRDAEGAYWSHTQIADLANNQVMASTHDLSLQYATYFALGPDTRSYQFSAVTGGERYARPEGSWRCSVQDLATETWTETYGSIDVARGLIHLKLPNGPADRLAAGEKAHTIGGQAWGSNSTDGRPQTNDWAQSKATFRGPDLAMTPAPSGGGLTACGDAPAPPAGADSAAAAAAGASSGVARTLSMPVAALTLLLLLGLALARRR